MAENSSVGTKENVSVLIRLIGGVSKNEDKKTPARHASNGGSRGAKNLYRYRKVADHCLKNILYCNSVGKLNVIKAILGQDGIGDNGPLTGFYNGRIPMQLRMVAVYKVVWESPNGNGSSR
ncbi:hypothetical protein SUGI_0425780 [Cryptomeria japonica]|nr:hypothetical protein SUGI_0425780 [Cryptomeria japonica]